MRISDIVLLRESRAKFYETQIGKLLRSYESARDNAWITENSPVSSDARTLRAWQQADIASDLLIAALIAATPLEEQP